MRSMKVPRHEEALLKPLHAKVPVPTRMDLYVQCTCGTVCLQRMHYAGWMMR